jgi:hypothetical protein
MVLQFDKIRCLLTFSLFYLPISYGRFPFAVAMLALSQNMHTLCKPLHALSLVKLRNCFGLHERQVSHGLLAVLGPPGSGLCLFPSLSTRIDIDGGCSLCNTTVTTNIDSVGHIDMAQPSRLSWTLNLSTMSG